MNAEQVKEIAMLARGSWEQQFCASVLDQIGRGRVLSPSQVSILDRIALNKNLQFVDMDDPEVSGQVFAAYVYYKGTPYFGNTIRRLEDGEALTTKDFEMFCRNKYAVGFRNNMIAGHKYALGDVVFVDGILHQVVEHIPMADWGKDTIQYVVLNLVNASQIVVPQRHMKLQTRKKKQ